MGFAPSPKRSPGRFQWTTMLSLMVRYAYDVRAWQVSGSMPPAYYAIQANHPEGASEAEIRLMLRKLLEARLGLKAGIKQQERSGYELVVAKNGPKLRAAGGSGELPPMPDYFKNMPADALKGRIVSSAEGPGTTAVTGRGVPIAKLAAELSEHAGAFVDDGTGLGGEYYFGFQFAGGGGANPAVESNAPGLFEAVQSELGLRLEKKKRPVDVLVIEHIDMTPAEN